MRTVNPDANRQRAARYYAQNREQVLNRLRQRYHSDPVVSGKKRAYAADWVTKNRQKWRDYALRHRHTKLGYPAPTRPRPAFCECCGREPGKSHRLALDHCHQTGVFRGWLCNLCNRAIGALGDNPEGVLKALTYLEKAYAL